MKKHILILLLFFLGLSTTIQAQHSSWCGTHISDDWMQAFYQRDKTHLTHKSNLPEVFIPIVYHIVGDDNGNGYYGLHELFRSHCELQELYTNANITFYIKSIEYIDDTDWYNGESTYGLFQRNDMNACNVYVVDDMDGVCGYSFVPENWDGSGWSGPNRGGIMLQKGCMQIGNTTYRHEMGHYLNLPHTFYGWEGDDAPGIGQNAPNFTPSGSPVERVDGSNCSNSGDGFCDTPPDYLSDRWTCTFDRNYRDPNGVLFTIDEKNFMSYSNDGCAIYLKDDQLAEVNNAPSAHRSYLLIDPVPSIPSLTIANPVYPADNATSINSGSVTIKWNAQDNADYYHLQLTQFNFTNPTIDIVVEDTFYVFNNASLDADYEWRVKPINLLNVCTDFTAIQQFSTSRLSATATVTDNACPDDANGAISFVIDQAGSYTYLWSSSDPIANDLVSNINSSNLNNLISGTYDVMVVSSTNDTLLSSVDVSAPGDIIVNINQVGTALVATISGGQPPYNYAWDDGSQDLSLTGITTGNYTFVVVDQNGCQKVETGYYDENSTAIRDINSNYPILITPNPVKSNFCKLHLPFETNEAITFDLIDLRGKVQYSQAIDKQNGINQYTISLPDLTNGLYFANIKIGNKQQTYKLIIQ